jgi:hypothetical protein
MYSDTAREWTYRQNTTDEMRRGIRHDGLAVPLPEQLSQYKLHQENL